MYYEYGKVEIEYLKKKDKKLSWAIDEIGMIQRETMNDIYESVIFHIIGQQISATALKTVWKRLLDKIGNVDEEKLNNLSLEELQSIGITFKKAEYIKKFTNKIINKELDLTELNDKEDEEVIEILSSLDGIGVWTAEMLMIFTMKRNNIVSYKDLAIIRGMRMLYRHKKIDKKMFDKYKKRYSPYGTIASLYLWAIAGGGIEELNDPTQINKRRK